MANTIHIATSGADEVFPGEQPIMAGDTPQMVTRDVPIPAALAALPQYTPLSFVNNAYKPWAAPVSSAGPVAQSGTGNGTLTGLTTVAGAPSETWTVRLITAAANGGTFSVNGSVSGAQPNATVGVAYNSGEVAFTINDGATDFVVGDQFVFSTVQSDERIVAMTAYAIPDQAVIQRCAVYTAGMFNIDAVNWPAATTEDHVLAATMDSQMQFRKLLYSDKRITQSGLLVGPAFTAPATG